MFKIEDQNASKSSWVEKGLPSLAAPTNLVVEVENVPSETRTSFVGRDAGQPIGMSLELSQVLLSGVAPFGRFQMLLSTHKFEGSNLAR
jgi:hypothetical protein